MAEERAREMSPGWRSPEEKKRQQEEDESLAQRRQDMLKGTMQGASSFAQKAARGDASAFGDAAQSGLSAAGGAVAGPLGAAGMDALVGAVRGMIDGLESLGKRLGEYSGQLAQANAEAELAQIMGDMRRAQYAGNELAKLSAESSRLSQVAQDALLKLVKPLIEPLAELIAMLSGWLEALGFGLNDTPTDAIAEAQAQARIAFQGNIPGEAAPVPFRERFGPLGRR
jgi:hypothetical protein